VSVVFFWVESFDDCREGLDVVLSGRSTFESQGTRSDLPADEENVL
jgi:hypothetical protein